MAVTEIAMEPKHMGSGPASASAAEAGSYADQQKFDEVLDHDVPEKYRGTEQDKQDMFALGKQQQLRRNFKLLTMTGFSSMVVCAWEGLLPLYTFVLIDGDPALMFWGFLAVACGMGLVYLSIAEIASMSPTAAGQYHWVSEFGPPKYQRLLSYCTGWLCAIGWQTFLTSVCFMVGTIIQALIMLNNENYEWAAWHGTLLSVAIISFCILFNTSLAGKLPLVEGVAVVVHIVALFAVVIPLWVMAPRSDAREVLLEFTNFGNWPTDGLAAMIGMTTPLSIWIGYDCSVHMAEEIHDAGRNLPRSILSAVSLNACLGFIMAMTLIFVTGDSEAILAAGDDLNGYPFLQIFMNAVQNVSAVNFMTFLVIFGLTNCAISETATASRQIWSFARDNGLPFSGWLSHVYPGQNIPLRAVGVSFCVVTLLSMINIGSDVALNAINSLAGVSLLTSYLITLGCVIHRRLTGPELPPRAWSLGKMGLPINIGGFLFLIPVWFFAFWPLENPATPENMNYASVIFFGCIFVAMIYWFAKAKNIYTGPVVQMRREQ